MVGGFRYSGFWVLLFDYDDEKIVIIGWVMLQLQLGVFGGGV